MSCEDGYVDILSDVNQEETQLESRDILLHILAELRIMNVHLSVLSDNEIKPEDLVPFQLD